MNELESTIVMPLLEVADDARSVKTRAQICLHDAKIKSSTILIIKYLPQIIVIQLIDLAAETA